MNLLAYDGSFNGLLSVTYYCLKNSIKPDYVFKFDNLPKASITKINTANYFNALKFLISKIGKRDLQNIYYAYLSEIENVESLIISYVFYKITNTTKKEIILTFHQIVQNVLHEVFYLSKEITFSKINDILFAKINPHNNILILLSNYFSEKLPKDTWLIYDSKRYSMFFYNNGKKLIFRNVKFNLDSNNDLIENLWKTIIQCKKIS